MEIRKNNLPISIKVREEGDETPSNSIGTLTGYISVFNTDSFDLGGFVEQVQPGAFTETLEKNDVVALINHQHSVVVGRMTAGTLRLHEDETGLYFEVDVPDTQAGRDLKILVERQDLLGCSFGFQIEGEEWSQRDGKDFCVLTKINLMEVSVGVTWPAYGDTSMKMRDRLTARRNNLRQRDKARLKNKV
jgi:HK97 family phage prohead protease